MITNAKFKYALKEMMNEMPLEDINVTALCARCGCHRQTFYYHFQDIYDLVAAILLTEDLGKFETAKTIREALRAFVLYARDNFVFLRQTYGSAAKDLVEDFMFGKFNAKIFSLIQANPAYENLKTDAKRGLSRRLANYISSEIGYCFKSPSYTSEKFYKKMNKIVDSSLTILLPALLEMNKKEDSK